MRERKKRENKGREWDVDIQDWPEGWPESIEVSGILQKNAT